MKEQEFIQIIKSTLNSKYIGDDCAYLKDLNILVSQDSLVEDVHFKKNLITPYQLGYKTVMVNISDICASGAKPLYLTISLSLPNDTNSNFIRDFYTGAKDAALGVEIVGGDITGSDKIYISATAIGSSKGRKISSRSHAKPGYKIIVSGEHGSSAYGLELLLKGNPEFTKNNIRCSQSHFHIFHTVPSKVDVKDIQIDEKDIQRTDAQTHQFYGPNGSGRIRNT